MKKQHQNLNRITGNCPYCDSNDIIKASSPISKELTRIPSYKCKDCNHTFSYGTYFNEKTTQVKTDMFLEDLNTYGLIEKTGEDTYRITDSGKQLVSDNNSNKLKKMDDLILKLPIWNDLSKIIPIHPSKEIFIKGLTELLKENLPNKSRQEWFWNRYNVEVVPALERRSKQGTQGIRGYQGITLIPYIRGELNEGQSNKNNEIII